ncbi:hypothetical protein TTHERM_00378650 (macronuclear) [Tetrahymena thermophila SB210]|uniref:Uncharacterized protein n=1 Tax=Tetrahymena thermophila (strain SB210) TaxID=312017 RepID=Q23FF2_TETTS|nr:hypothetical protein TTHERM_00378650 [Tetrahymena thermophila SB210]EAR95201.1 hypothetical protein TTHERM_00378650 [Tetrahymena thermophila SB210]|eukprot:XP_001015446.1 hypothetical protein TTHERM_00378650 [Tetrahymena thermophila SB210]
MENKHNFNSNNLQVQQRPQDNQTIYFNSTNTQNTNFTIQSSQNRVLQYPNQSFSNNLNARIQQRETPFNLTDNESEQSEVLSDFLSELFDNLVESDDSFEQLSDIFSSDDDSQMQVETQEMFIQNEVSEQQQRQINQFLNYDEQMSISSIDEQDQYRFISYKEFKLRHQNIIHEDANQCIEDSWDLNQDDFLEQSDNQDDFLEQSDTSSDF